MHEWHSATPGDALISLMACCCAVRCRPEHALSCAEGVRMTMLFITVHGVMKYRNISTHEKPCTSRRYHVIVSGANDLADAALQSHGNRRATRCILPGISNEKPCHGEWSEPSHRICSAIALRPLRHAARSLPPVRMTWRFVAARCAMERRAVQ